MLASALFANDFDDLLANLRDDDVPDVTTL